ncbi:MAG: hydroxyisourate hydrolase [Pseudomonadota bacterium]
MAGLTTHILDTASGRPAAGVPLSLSRIDGERRTLVANAVTNADGRTDAPLLSGEQLDGGCYELEFEVGDYFSRDMQNPPAFLGTVVVRVNLEAGEDYHVPLLVSPYGYSTYRGS